MDDLESVRQALQQENVKALFCESIANPGGAISDLEALAKLTDVSTGLCCLLVHNSFLTHTYSTHIGDWSSVGRRQYLGDSLLL